MIKKIIKILSNPQGALVQAVFGLCEAFIKKFIKDHIEERLEKADLSMDALKDMVISQQRELDDIKKSIKRGK
jgi:hypothetical protein